jgi:ribokinase
VWEEAGGGGAVAAVQLAKLAGRSLFLTALGEDEHGRESHARLATMGVDLHVAWRSAPQRRAITFVDDNGERTITTLADRMVPAAADPLPWPRLAALDAIYFTGGDADALRAARQARILVATPRAADTIEEAGVELDALVYSDGDDGERAGAARVADRARLRIATQGAAGGRWEDAGGAHGRWDATPLPGAPVDSYGAGDSFAAGLTFGLATEPDLDAALRLAARCGAACVCGHGPYEGQLTLT